jgi:hypothetical protein
MALLSAAFSNAGEASSPADIEVEVDVEGDLEKALYDSDLRTAIAMAEKLYTKVSARAHGATRRSPDLHGHGHKSVTKRG